MYCIILAYFLDFFDVPIDKTAERILRNVVSDEFANVGHVNDVWHDNQFSPRLDSTICEMGTHFGCRRGKPGGGPS